MTNYSEPTFKAIKMTTEDILTSSTSLSPNETGLMGTGSVTDIVDEITIAL